MKGQGLLLPQGQCSYGGNACNLHDPVRRNSGSLGTSLKWNPLPFKVCMLEMGLGLTWAQLFLGRFSSVQLFSFLLLCAVCSALVLSVLFFTNKSWALFIGGVM